MEHEKQTPPRFTVELGKYRNPPPEKACAVCAVLLILFCAFATVTACGVFVAWFLGY